jgi:hypothetical protein
MDYINISNNNNTKPWIKFLYASEVFWLLLSLVISTIFAPWSKGPLYFLAFILVYEIILLFVLWYLSKIHHPYWTLSYRISVLFVSLFGFILGKVIAGQDPLVHK